MGLRTKFNLVLLLVCMIGLVFSGLLSYALLHRNAREEVIQNAGVMMASALAIRDYTVDHVKPNLELQLMRAFLPESVPAFAATETFNGLRTKYPAFTYKEATLNPTNLRDRAADWEADVIQEFRNDKKKSELIGERDTPTGRTLYMARPIVVKQEACLICHSAPAAAPKTMLSLYGDNNGFGWKLNETIGAQVVSVPMSLPIAKANRAFALFMASLFGVFILLFVALNIMLSRIVIRRIMGMSAVADQVSMGATDAPEINQAGSDEIATLAASFNRMRTSLEKAMKMIEE